MVVEPANTQHPDIQKLGLTVKKLDEVTQEALSAFFNDEEQPGNSKKKAMLQEIFRVAKQEERFKNGEIGRFMLHWRGFKLLTLPRRGPPGLCHCRRQV